MLATIDKPIHIGTFKKLLNQIIGENISSHKFFDA
jgi:hypothetical protein